MKMPQESRVLIVDDNPAIHEDFRKILVSSDACDELNRLESELFGTPQETTTQAPIYEIDSAFQGEEGVNCVAQAVKENRPYALAFVDMRMPPGICGVETITQLWEHAPELQTVVCTAYSDYSWSEIIEKLGWSDRLLILKKPFDKAEVCQMALALSVKYRLERVAQLKTADLRTMVTKRTIELEKEIARRKQIETMLRESANQTHDPTDIDNATGLLNRDAVLKRIKFMAADADQHAARYSLLFVDVDGLAGIIEQFGSAAGDSVLKFVSLRVREVLRPNDVFGRFGSEEFIVGMRNCSRNGAAEVGGRICEAVSRTPVSIEDNQINVTVSVGVATQDDTISAVTDRVIECADQALEMAKTERHNRVISELALFKPGMIPIIDIPTSTQVSTDPV